MRIAGTDFSVPAKCKKIDNGRQYDEKVYEYIYPWGG